ncbi:hypothetical protein WEH80_26720 [Actinomycetes bacterium KLBMP 9759]
MGPPVHAVRPLFGRVVGFLIVSHPSATGGVTLAVVGLSIAFFGGAPIAGLGIDLVVSSAPDEKSGSASSISETNIEFGMAFGVAVMGSISATVDRSQMAAKSFARRRRRGARHHGGRHRCGSRSTRSRRRVAGHRGSGGVHIRFRHSSRRVRRGHRRARGDAAPPRPGRWCHPGGHRCRRTRPNDITGNETSSTAAG